MFNWFKKKQVKLDPIDFSNIKVDIHSHLIPGIDDGAKSKGDFLKKIKEINESGEYDREVATDLRESVEFFEAEEYHQDASFFSVLETESATNEEYKADMISMLDEIVTGNF